MANFIITRKSFPDRLLTFDELDTFAEMLRSWYLLAAGKGGNNAQIQCETIIYAFPRSDTKIIRETLAPLLPDASWDNPDPDELRASTLTAINARQSNPSQYLARDILLSPHRTKCLHPASHHHSGSKCPGKEQGIKTFVFCGLPTPFGLTLKAIWDLGADERWQTIYKYAVWPSEKQLLDAFDLYIKTNSTDRSANAARASYAFFRKKERHLFQSRTIERQANWLVSLLAELPDERRPIAFIRRITISLILGIILISVAAFCPPIHILSIFGLAFIILAVRIVWKKAQRINAYRTAMRRGLGTMYSNPVEYKQVDLADDLSPTLLKCSREFETLLGLQTLYLRHRHRPPLRQTSMAIACTRSTKQLSSSACLR